MARAETILFIRIKLPPFEYMATILYGITISELLPVTAEIKVTYVLTYVIWVDPWRFTLLPYIYRNEVFFLCPNPICHPT